MILMPLMFKSLIFFSFLSRPKEKPSHDFQPAFGLDFAAPLAQALVVPSNWEKGEKSPALIPIQDYNTLNRKPSGSHRVNKPQTRIPLQESARQPHRGGEKKRLINRGESFWRRLGIERGEEVEKLGRERMAGRLKC